MSAAQLEQTTRDGRPINRFSGLCGRCSDLAAQTAVFITDDAEWDSGPSPDPAVSLEVYRWRLIQRRMTEHRAECVRFCGRGRREGD